MTSTLALVLLALAAPPKKLAAPGLSGLDVPADALAFYNEHLSLQLGSRGLEVVTAKQIEAVIGLERQRELLGCADASCLTEIASALGADAVVIGEVGRFGETIQVNLKIIAASDARVLASFSKRVPKDDVLEGLTEGAAAMAAALGLGAPAPAAAKVQIPLAAPLGVGLAGAVGVGAGIGLLLQSRTHWSQLHDPVSPLGDQKAADIAAAGASEQTWGWVAVGAGCALVATATVLEVMRVWNKPVSGAVVVTPSGAAASLSVRLP